jgi:hypothetical protein
MRVKFKKGNQRDFLIKVLEASNCPSLRELISRGFDIPYSTLKNYYSEIRLMSLDLFERLCIFSGLEKEDFDYVILKDNWGQVKGGKN